VSYRYRPQGDLSLIRNYRPISLTDTRRKLYELSFLAHLQPLAPSHVNRALHPLHHQPGRIVGTLIRFAKKPELAFMDIKAAYDSVPRPALWKRCLEIGLNPCLVRSLMSLFDHSSAQLAVKQNRFQPFIQHAGVLQGSVLGPLLYAIYIDLLVEKLRSGPDDSKMNCLLYADDII